MSDYGNATALFHTLTSEDSDSDHAASGASGFRGGGSPAPRQLAGRAQLQPEGPESTSATKKPRGRPPGSKNKPKIPLVITRESESAMKPVVLEISAGSDVIEMVTGFARRRGLGVTLLSGTGTVSDVTLRHPMPSHSSLVSLHGPFHLLSLWGSFMGFITKAASTSAQNGFGITLSGAQGQVFGGVVGGKVVAAGPVVVVAATFLNPPFHRLSPSLEDRDGGSGPDGDDEQQAAGKKRCEGGFGGESICSPISALPPNY